MSTPTFSPVAPEAVYVPEVVAEPVAEVTAEVEIQTPETPVIEEPPVAVATEVQEKIVEKIVEKYPEMDDHQQTILQYIIEGKTKELGDFIAESQRDYSTMSDYDVVKAYLKAKNPTWSNDDIETKIEVQYGELVKVSTKDLDPDINQNEYAEAEAHNKTVERNLKVLHLESLEPRGVLEASKKAITLPKIQQQTEVQQQPTAEEIAQGRAVWEATVTAEVPKVKELAWKVGDEDVSYKINDAEQTETLEIMKNLNSNSLALELGWMDKDGKQNVSKIAGDVLLLKKAKQIIASAYTQGKTAGAKGTAANIKNIDLSNKSQTTVAATPPDIGILGFGHLNPK